MYKEIMENILNCSDYLELGVKEVDEHMIQIHWVVHGPMWSRNDNEIQLKHK